MISYSKTIGIRLSIWWLLYVGAGVFFIGWAANDLVFTVEQASLKALQETAHLEHDFTAITLEIYLLPTNYNAISIRFLIAVLAFGFLLKNFPSRKKLIESNPNRVAVRFVIMWMLYITAAVWAISIFIYFPDHNTQISDSALVFRYFLWVLAFLFLFNKFPSRRKLIEKDLNDHNKKIQAEIYILELAEKKLELAEKTDKEKSALKQRREQLLQKISKSDVSIDDL